MTATMTTARTRQFILFGRAKAKEFTKKLQHVAAYSFEHLLMIGGFAAIAFGAWMIYRPLGPMLGGWFAIKIALLISAERGQ